MKWVLIVLGVLVAGAIAKKFESPQREFTVAETTNMCDLLGGMGGMAVLMRQSNHPDYQLSAMLKESDKYGRAGPMYKEMIVNAESFNGDKMDFSAEWKGKCLKKFLDY